jgi:hypothetical protein
MVTLVTGILIIINHFSEQILQKARDVDICKNEKKTHVKRKVWLFSLADTPFFALIAK